MVNATCRGNPTLQHLVMLREEKKQNKNTTNAFIVLRDCGEPVCSVRLRVEG